MNTENMINITGISIICLVQKAFEMSVPQGMGFLHSQPNDTLTDAQARNLIDYSLRCIVSMDYVKGRACKFNVFRDGENYYIRDRWFDHGDHQLGMLLQPHQNQLPKPLSDRTAELLTLVNE